MARPFGVISLILLCGLLTRDSRSGGPGFAGSLCTIPTTQVIRIPVSKLTAQKTTESLNAAPATLMIWPGAADEPPEGPVGFDVLEDGSLLVTDPLRSQISFFEADGKFRKAWKIGFPADSLTAMRNGMVLVREATTGRLLAFDQDGHARPAEAATLPERAEARVLTGQNRATVIRSAIDNTHGGPLEIQFDKPGLTLLSAESLATDQKGDTYVALETTASGGAAEGISLNKYVRRYASDGKLLCEIADIPLDYYVPPVDELRVHRGVVYQLQTTKSEVRVNVWDTNPLCSGSSH